MPPGESVEHHIVLPKDLNLSLIKSLDSAANLHEIQRVEELCYEYTIHRVKSVEYSIGQMPQLPQQINYKNNREMEGKCIG